MSDGRRSGGRRPAPGGGGVLLVIGGLALLALGFVVGIVVLGQPPGGPDPGDPALGAGLSTASGSTTPPAATTKPAKRVPIRFEPPRINVGVLKPGQSATATVRVRNIGTEPLKILSSRASCGCTSVDLANTVLEPGGSAPLTVRYDAGGLGKKQENISVLFEGYDQPADLAVLVEVDLAVRAVPTYIAASQAMSGWLTVQSLDGRPFRILGSNGKAPVYNAFDPEVDEPRPGYRVKWDLTPFDATTCQDADGNPMPGWWVIETDHPECPIFDLTVRHVCTVPPQRPPDRRPWVLSQTRVPIGRLEPGEAAEFRVSLKWLGGAEPDDTVYAALSESPEQFDAELVTVEQRGTMNEALIRVTPRDDFRGLVYGTLQVYSARHSAPLVVIGQVAE